MFFFHIPENIYVGYYNEEIIALDIVADKYYILNEKLSQVFEFCIKNKFMQVKDQYWILTDSKENNGLFQNSKTAIEKFNQLLKKILNLKLLFLRSYPSNHFNKIPKKNSSGAANIDWRMPSGILDIPASKKTCIEAYLILIYVYVTVKFFGIKHLINSIKKSSKRYSFFIEDSPDNFNELVLALNKACFFFPKGVKCLEWSVALVLMGLRRKWRCNIEIGVQNIPFSAHAWVKVGDQIIADSSDLPEKLLIILSEPFNGNK